MKRTRLICMLVGLCALVAITGNLALVRVNHGITAASGLRSDKRPTCHIMVDLEDARLYLVKEDTILSSYPVAIGNEKHPSPEGSWNAQKRTAKIKGRVYRWLELDVPWGRYSLHGNELKSGVGKAGGMMDEGSIKLFSDDMLALYHSIEMDAKITVMIYGKQQGLAGMKLQKGSKGAGVYEIERRLRQMGYYVGRVDGIYDNTLEEAIHKFQKSSNLKEADILDASFLTKLGMAVLE